VETGVVGICAGAGSLVGGAGTVVGICTGAGEERTKSPTVGAGDGIESCGEGVRSPADGADTGVGVVGLASG